jgi:aminocarboxymuconate-semialdehyde decarboxylase
MSRDFVDPARHLARMDRLGIELSVLSLATPLIDYRVAADHAVNAARVFNDEVARLKQAHPGRFDGWAFLPMQSPEAAVEELGRAVHELGLRGGHVASNVNGTYLDHPAYTPLFEAAAGWQVPLFVHPCNPPGRDRLQRYELEVVSGYLFDTTVNIFNMIFGGLLDRFPNLRLCCTHTGGYALLLAGRMQREVDTNPELARRIKHPVADYLRRLYYDTVCLDRNYLRRAADLVGAERLVLGSDHPFLLGEPDPVGFVRAAFPERELQDRVLRRNAADMVGRSTHEPTPA